MSTVLIIVMLSAGVWWQRWLYKTGLHRGCSGIGWTLTVIFMPWAAFTFLKAASVSGPVEPLDKWLASVAHLKHRHGFNGHGIAVDSERGVLHLKGFLNRKPIEKIVSFADVRSWTPKIVGGGYVTGVEVQDVHGNVVGHSHAGLQGIGYNLGKRAANAAASGLFVSVHDTEMPEWRIEFKYDASLEGELKRWAEVLRQTVREGVQVRTSAGSAVPA